MSKPREFWILDNGTDPYYTAYSRENRTSYPTVYVREVVPIDWSKLSQEYWNKGGCADRDEIKMIQELVEKQLTGKEE